MAASVSIVTLFLGIRAFPSRKKASDAAGVLAESPSYSLTKVQACPAVFLPSSIDGPVDYPLQFRSMALILQVEYCQKRSF